MSETETITLSFLSLILLIGFLWVLKYKKSQTQYLMRRLNMALDENGKLHVKVSDELRKRAEFVKKHADSESTLRDELTKYKSTLKETLVLLEIQAFL